jgi:hypothetical protein
VLEVSLATLLGLFLLLSVKIPITLSVAMLIAIAVLAIWSKFDTGFTASDTPPRFPREGDRWLDTKDGKLSTWTLNDDGEHGQWIAYNDQDGG